MYKSVLRQAQPERELYLAVSDEVRDAILSEELGELMLAEYIGRGFYFSVEREEIVAWEL